MCKIVHVKQSVYHNVYTNNGVVTQVIHKTIQIRTKLKF